MVAPEQAPTPPRRRLVDGPRLRPQLGLVVVRELRDLLGMHGGLRSVLLTSVPYDRFRTESVRNKDEITEMLFAERYPAWARLGARRRLRSATT